MTGFDPKYFRLAKTTTGSRICSNIGCRLSQFNIGLLHRPTGFK